MLYSVRRACERDFAATVRAVADLGYEGVELFDLHGEEPEVVGGWLRENGLEPLGRHALLDSIEQDLPRLAAEARAVGWRRLVVSWVDPVALDDATLDRLAHAATRVGELGLELGYHNHDAEVRGGFLDRLPARVFAEVDLGWAWWAGADPVGLLGRGPLVHVKDFRTRGERSFCPVGDGSVGYARVLPAAAARAQWLVVEQDEADDELAAAERSLAFVRGALA